MIQYRYAGPDTVKLKKGITLKDVTQGVALEVNAADATDTSAPGQLS